MRRRYQRGKPATPTATKREGIGYSRVSSKEQEKEGFSIPAQNKLREEYARQVSIPVTHAFDEAETAKKKGRTKFDQMIALIRKSPERYAVLVEKTDRIYRNFPD